MGNENQAKGGQQSKKTVENQQYQQKEKFDPTLASKLAEIARNPHKNPEIVAKQIAERIGAFRDSTHSDINKLLSIDHSKPEHFIKNKDVAEAARKALLKATENIQVIDGLIAILQDKFDFIDTESGKKTSLQAQIEELKTFRQFIQESIDGYNYRAKNNLPSGNKQVEQYIDSIADGTDPEPYVGEPQYKPGDKLLGRAPTRQENPDYVEQKIRFENQPDIADVYHAVAAEKELTVDIFTKHDMTKDNGELVTITEMLTLVDSLSKDFAPSQLDATKTETAVRIIKTLKEMSQLPMFGGQAEAGLKALEDRIRQDLEAMTGVDIILPLIGYYEQIDRADKKGDAKMDQLVAEVKRIFLTTELAKDGDGWVQIDKKTAMALHDLARKYKHQYETLRPVDLLPDKFKGKEIQEGRKLLDAKVEFCDAIEKLMLKLLESKKQIAVVRPLLDELQLKASYLTRQAPETASA